MFLISFGGIKMMQECFMNISFPGKGENKECYNSGPRLTGKIPARSAPSAVSPILSGLELSATTNKNPQS